MHSADAGQPVEPGGQQSIELSDGALIQNLCVADGNSTAALEAKIGSVCSVHYEGRLACSNEVFDSHMEGPGSKFELDCDGVIRGLDIGVVGMKFGTKRRISCLLECAYGPEGRPPLVAHQLFHATQH